MVAPRKCLSRNFKAKNKGLARRALPHLNICSEPCAIELRHRIVPPLQTHNPSRRRLKPRNASLLFTLCNTLRPDVPESHCPSARAEGHFLCVADAGAGIGHARPRAGHPAIVWRLEERAGGFGGDLTDYFHAVGAGGRAVDRGGPMAGERFTWLGGVRSFGEAWKGGVSAVEGEERGALRQSQDYRDQVHEG